METVEDMQKRIEELEEQVEQLADEKEELKLELTAAEDAVYDLEDKHSEVVERLREHLREIVLVAHVFDPVRVEYNLIKLGLAQWMPELRFVMEGSRQRYAEHQREARA